MIYAYDPYNKNIGNLWVKLLFRKLLYLPKLGIFHNLPGILL